MAGTPEDEVPCDSQLRYHPKLSVQMKQAWNPYDLQAKNG